MNMEQFLLYLLGEITEVLTQELRNNYKSLIEALILWTILKYVLGDVIKYVIHIIRVLLKKLQTTIKMLVEEIQEIKINKYIKDRKYRTYVTEYILRNFLYMLRDEIYDWYKCTVKPTLRMCVRTEISKIKYGMSEEARQREIEVRMKIRTRKEKEEQRFHSREEIEQMVNRMFKRRIWRRLEKLKKQVQEHIKRREKK